MPFNNRKPPATSNRGEGQGEESIEPANRAELANAALTGSASLLEATLSSIPDYVYAFDRQRRFVYANPAMLSLFVRSADEMLGKTFAELGYPRDMIDRLNGHIDLVLSDGVTVEDEVFYDTPSGYAAFFSFLWGPVRGADGSVELVVGVSRDTSERRSFEERLSKSEARLRAATELAGLGIYAWDPVTGALEWDERMRVLWGLAPGSEVTMEVFEAGIHGDDLPRVRRAIEQCIDPAGGGWYDIEYRVLGHADGAMRHIATNGRTTFADGAATGFIGAAVDVTAQRRTEAAIRASEAQFRSFADNSSNLLWIADVREDRIIYRSATYERIWGLPCSDGPTALGEWMNDVHPDDRQQVEHALDTVKAGETVQFEYRIVRPSDSAIRTLRETSFPILDEHGASMLIGGITEDLTQEDVRQVYVVCGRAAEARRLAGIVRTEGYKVRTFPNASAFLDVAPVLASGCVLVDLRKTRSEGLTILRELKARSIPLPTIVLAEPSEGVEAAVAAMKAGAVDYLPMGKEGTVPPTLVAALAECVGTVRSLTRDENAGARVARLTPREREVLVGLVDGGTNKSIAKMLGISPRTVELHRAQVMNRLNANSLTELLQIALAAGISPSAGVG